MDTTSEKPKILSILKVPPPITGATLSNVRFIENKNINEKYNIRHIKVSYAGNVSSLGKVSLHKFFVFTGLFLRVISSVISFRPELVYFQISPKGIAFLRDYLLVIILKISRHRIIFHVRGIGIRPISENHKLLKKLYQNAFMKNYVIVFSDNVKDDLSLVYKGEPFIVPNGIERTISESDLTMKNTTHQKVKILFISNYLEAKGVFDIIEIARLIKTSNFELIMIGAVSDPFVYETMLGLIENYDLSEIVKPVGAVYNEKKTQYLLNSDIFVFPTLNEGFGNVALEAMEASLPIVAYYEGSLPFIIKDQESGFLVPKKNHTAFARKLELLIKDNKLRKEMGANGRARFLEQFTIEKFEENIIQTFNSVIADAR